MGRQINSRTHHHANIIAYTRLITMGNPDITNELQRIDERKQNESTERDRPLV
jgi:hypothetical protein